MKPKIPTPKIFIEESCETPKHDNMLLIYSKGSEKLNVILDKYIEKVPEKIISLFMDGKTTYRQTTKIFKSGYDNEYYFSKDSGDYYIEKWKNNEETYKSNFEQYIKDGSLKKLSGEFKEVTLKSRIEYEIIEYEPEKAIMHNSFYIGSIDLFIMVKYTIYYDIYYNNNLLCKDYEKSSNYQEFIIEFKPIIKSFSETIRQVKVYQKHFSSANPIVITYSDISKFKDIFESQNIKLIQIIEEK